MLDYSSLEATTTTPSAAPRPVVAAPPPPPSPSLSASRATVGNGGPPGSFASFRALLNRDGSLPRDDLASSSSASSAFPAPGPDSRLVDVVGLDRGRLNFEGVFLNSMCSLRRLGLRNVSGGTVVVRLGSSVGDQLRWQLRNDNLNVLPVELQHVATNTVAAVSRLSDLPESNAMFDSVGLISDVTLEAGETKDIVAAFRPDSTHFHPSTINYDPTAATKLDTYSEQGLSSVSIAESSLSSATNNHSPDSRSGPTAHNLATIDGYVNLDASLLAPAGSDAPFVAVQQVSIEFHATCCRSFFTLSAKDSDPSSSLDEIHLDFGTVRVAELTTRDCEILNRSAVELFWRIDGLPSLPALQVECLETGAWISSGGLASVPPYGSRRLRFHFRPTEPNEIDTELTFENVADPDNIVLLHLHGSVTSAPLDNTLRIVSGASLDFGDCCAGEWSQQTVAFTNISGAPLEVAFSAEKGYDVTFRLEAGTAEDDDEGEPRRDTSGGTTALGANAVEPLNLAPATPEPMSQLRDPMANHSRTIIHELARGTTTSLPPQRSLLAASRPFTAPRSPRSIQSDQTFGSSSEQPTTDSHVSEALSAPHQATKTYLPPTSSALGTRDFRSPLGANSTVSSLDPSSSQGDAFALLSNHASTLDDPSSSASHLDPSSATRPATSSSSHRVDSTSSERGLFRVTDHLKLLEQRQRASVDQIYVKPGLVSRIIVSYRPLRVSSFDADGSAGKLSKRNFKVHVSWRPWGTRGKGGERDKERKTISCKARACSSFISVLPGVIDFGEVELGTSVQGTISVTNLSEISARVDLRFISKVLSAYRDEIEIGVGKTVDVKVDMVPRRTNASYQKQVSVHNLLNPDNSQVCLIKAANVDTRGVAFHSLFYRLLTPTGGNFVEFGSVPVNSFALRAITIQNTSTSPLALDLSAEHAVDYQLFVKKADAPPPVPSATTVAMTDGASSPAPTGLATADTNLSALSNPPSPRLNGSASIKPDQHELKERVLEAIFNPSPSTATTTASAAAATAASKVNGLGTQLKEGDKGKATLTYGNSVGFKDRGLLRDAEYLDLATGPPVRKSSPRGKRTLVFDSSDPRSSSSSRHRPSKLSFQPRTASSSSSSATGTGAKGSANTSPSSAHDESLSTRRKVSDSVSGASIGDLGCPPTTPSKRKSSRQPSGASSSATGTSGTSPALTARRRTRNVFPLPSDPSKLSLDEVLTALEHHSGHPDSSELSSWELEDAYVRRFTALRRTLKNAVAGGELAEVKSVEVAAQAEKTIYILVHPVGTRASIQGTSRKQDGKIAIHLRSFGSLDLLDPSSPSLPPSSDIPVREVVLRWTTCRSTMDLGMAHLNFGQMEKSSSKTKKIVISNASERPLLYAVRKSGSIASGDIRLAEGRHGVIAGYGKREVSIIFEPHFAGTFEETIHVDNVEDETEQQTVRVKAFILRPPTFSVSTAALDFGECAIHSMSTPRTVAITNISKSQRTFSVALDSTDFYFGRVALDVVLDPSATTSKVRGPLSPEEEEEVENILQKLKISRRKGQPEKEEKYVARLNLLGVPVPPADSVPPPSSPALGKGDATFDAKTVAAAPVVASEVIGHGSQGGAVIVVPPTPTLSGTAPPSSSNLSSASVSPADSIPPIVAAAASASFLATKSRSSSTNTAERTSSVTFTLEPSSRRELAIVIVPRPILPALEDGKEFEDVSAPVTISENADSKSVVVLTARVLLNPSSWGSLATEVEAPLVVGV